MIAYFASSRRRPYLSFMPSRLRAIRNVRYRVPANWRYRPPPDDRPHSRMDVRTSAQPRHGTCESRTCLLRRHTKGYALELHRRFIPARFIFTGENPPAALCHRTTLVCPSTAAIWPRYSDHAGSARTKTPDPAYQIGCKSSVFNPLNTIKTRP